MHARLQPLEAWNALLVQRHDLAIEDGLIRAGQGLRRLCPLGILLRAIEEVPCLQTDLAAIYERDRPHAVPFRLVDELGRVERLIRGRGEHRHDLPHERIVLRRSAVLDHQPIAALVLAGLDDDPFTIEAFALHPDLELVVLLFEELVRAGIPDRHRPRAVAVGDHAVKREVLDRMVLGVNGEASFPGLEWRTVRHSPGREDAAHLEPNVPVETRRVVPMHHVAPRLFTLRLLALRLRCAAEVAFALIIGEAQSVPFAIVGEVASWRPRRFRRSSRTTSKNATRSRRPGPARSAWWRTTSAPTIYRRRHSGAARPPWSSGRGASTRSPTTRLQTRSGLTVTSFSRRSGGPSSPSRCSTGSVNRISI